MTDVSGVTTTQPSKDRDGSSDACGAATTQGSTQRKKDPTTPDQNGAKPESETQKKEKPKLDQCGLENDKENWVKWEGPQRFKESKLTAEEKEKAGKILEQIFCRDSAHLTYRLPIDGNDVVWVMEKVIPYLEAEPMLIEDVPFGITVVGDLHGQLHDLDRIYREHARDGKPGWQCAKFLFLGNYVDRGRQQLETVMALFCIKMLRPDDVFLLRGNHEFENVQKMHDFPLHLMIRYEYEDAYNLWLHINEAFCYLSVAAIVGNTYLCVHGGVSPTMFTRRHLRAMRKPVISYLSHATIADIVWSDPAEGLRGWSFNSVRRNGVIFGFEALATAMYQMDVKGVIRGHTTLKNGYQHLWSCLFSLDSTADAAEGTLAGYARISDIGRVALCSFPQNIHRKEWEAKLRAAQEESQPEEATHGEAGVRHVDNKNK